MWRLCSVLCARTAIGLMAAFLISGCAASAKVVQIGPDSYALNVGAMGIEGGEAGARNKGVATAGEFCAKQNRLLNLVKIESKGPVELGSAAGSASLSFRCDPLTGPAR
jgi:hypothetical protein